MEEYENYTSQQSDTVPGTGSQSNGTYTNENAYQGGTQYYQSTSTQYRTPNPHRNSKPEKPKKEHKFLKLVASALVFGLVAGCGFQGVNLAARHFFPQDQAVQEIPITGNSDSSSEDTAQKHNASYGQADAAAVAKKCMPSIVSITNMSVAEVQSWFGIQSQEIKSAGSGVIVGENETELLIVTNNHVIANANTLTVTFCDNTSLEARLKGTDEDNDVAVIAVKLSDIEEATKNEIKIAALGDSDALVVGEPAIAIGNALGYGQSVTAGIISATNREFKDRSLAGSFIQTDAAINPGNSGGALLNAAGELIGINVAKEASSEVDSMGYAIPISRAKPIMNDLMSRETKELVPEEERGALGIYGADIDDSAAQTYGMPTGVYISDLVAGGAAETAGLQKGDIITKLDGSRVSSMEGLKKLLQYCRGGETVTVTVQRSSNGEYEEMEIAVLLQLSSSLDTEEQPQEEEIPDQGDSGDENSGNNYEGGNGYNPFDDFFGGFFNFGR